jgi:hypothetical protein
MARVIRGIEDKGFGRVSQIERAGLLAGERHIVVVPDKQVYVFAGKIDAVRKCPRFNDFLLWPAVAPAVTQDGGFSIGEAPTQMVGAVIATA